MDCCKKPTFNVCIANSTPWRVEVKLTFSRIQLQSRRIKTRQEIYGEIQMDPKIGGKLRRDYSAKEDRVEHTSKFPLDPWHHNKNMLKIPWEKGKSTFLTITVFHPEGKIEMVSSRRVTLEEHIRQCIWNNNGRPFLTGIAPEPMTLRFAENNGLGRNYDPANKCEFCGEEIGC